MTAPPRTDPETQAFLALLHAGLDPSGIAVFDGQVTGTPVGQYVVVYPTPGTLDAATGSGEHQDLTCTVQVTCCGPTRRDAMAAADAARVAVVDQRIDVTGRGGDLIGQIPLDVPARRDDTGQSTTDLPIWSVVTQFRWRSVPA